MHELSSAGQRIKSKGGKLKHPTSWQWREKKRLIRDIFYR
jgi:hypothetical protein